MQQLAEFYHFCSPHQNCTIRIDFSGIQFFEANLSAVLLALARKLSRENSLQFSLYNRISNGNDLCVIKRNGLVNQLLNEEGIAADSRRSVIPVRSFQTDDADGFADYVEWDLFLHRGLEAVTGEQALKLKNSYFEIFDNVGIHANTAYPVVACGQFFPRQRELKFTLVDTGDGFLKRIKAYTKNTEKPIENAKEAIIWAIKGGSTKAEAQGGTGLKKILLYCLQNNGAFHIYSDGCYWSYDKQVASSTQVKLVAGTTIHLIFRNL